MKNAMKKYWYLGSMLALLVAIVAGVHAVHPFAVRTADAQGAAASTVTFGLNVYGYSIKTNGTPNQVIGTGPIVDSSGNAINPNDYRSGTPHAIYLNASSYSVDFRVGLEICQPDGTNCHQGWTPWASQMAANPTGDPYSPIVGGGPNESGSVTCGAQEATLHNRLGDIFIGVQTRSLPQGEILNNVSLTLIPVEWDFHVPVDSVTPLNCLDPGEIQAIPGITPAGGGWSGGAFDKWNNASTDGFVIGLNVGSVLNASPVGSNIPTSFGVHEIKTNGTNNNPLEITMKNTGTLAWPSTKGQPTNLSSQSGTCQVDVDNAGVKDAPASTTANYGVSCTTDFVFNGTMNLLSHSGSFIPANQPVGYEQVAPVTITFVAPKKIYIKTCTGGGLLTALAKPQDTFGWIPTAYAIPFTGAGCTVVPYTIPAYYDYAYGSASQPTEVGNGASATFNLGSLAAPTTTGVYTETWQMQSNGVPFGTPFTTTITVGTPGNLGTINVVSYTDAGGGSQTSIPATWVILGPTSASTYTQATPASSATYVNVPETSGSGSNSATYTMNAQSAMGYTLKSVRMGYVAMDEKTAATGLLAVLAEPLINTAHAEVTSSTLDTTNLGNVNSVTLQNNANHVATFYLDWAPPSSHLACVSNSCALVVGSGSNQNGCTVVGQACTSGGGGPSVNLSAYPASGPAPLTTTLTATVSGGSGTYNYTFWSNCSYAGSNVGNAITQCGQPTKKDNAVAATSDTAAITYPSAGTDRALVIVENGNNAFSAAATVTVTGGGTNQHLACVSNSCALVAGSGSNQNGCTAVGQACAGGPTSCTSFTASSTTIVPGEKSTLSWSCSAGPCSIDNGVGGVNPSGSYAVNPTTTTQYTLTCNGVGTSTTVIVQNPSQKEVNP